MRKLFAVLILLAIPAFAVTVEIQPGTNIQSVINATSAATPNTFILKKGVHREQNVAARAGDTVTGELNQDGSIGTILSGARTISTWTQDGSGRWYATGQAQENPRVDGDGNDWIFADPDSGPEDGNGHSCWIDPATGQPANPRCWRPEDLFMDGQPLIHALSYATLAPGRFYFDYAADRIYMYDSPVGKLMEASTIRFAANNSAANVTWRNIIVEKYANPGQSGCFGGGGNAGFAGGGWLLEDMEIRYCHGTGLEHVSGMVVRRVKVHHNGQAGVHAGGGSGQRFYDGEIYNNNNLRYNYDWEGGGTKWAFANNVIVQNTKVYNNHGNGIWFDIDNDNITIRNNHVYDNLGMGIFYEISWAPALIEGNVVERNGLGRPAAQQDVWWGGCIHIASSGRLAGDSTSKIIVQNNTCRLNTVGIMASQNFRGASDPVWGGRFPGQAYLAEHTEFLNNTVIQDRATAAGVAIAGTWIEGGGQNPWNTGLVFEGNNYQVTNVNGNWFDRLGATNWTNWRNLGYDNPVGTIGPIVAQSPVEPLPVGATALSDRTATNVINHWGPMERDMSNGDLAAGDGGPIIINGTTYAKGLGMHAPAEATYALGGNCNTFTATVGIDDSQGTAGSVQFEVYADGTRIYQSSILTGSSAGAAINVSIVGRQSLRLVATNGGDVTNVNFNDHADWGNAAITCSASVTGGTPRAVVRTRLNVNSVGPSIDAATTITPTHRSHRINGTTTITTIAASNAQAGDTLILTSGNGGTAINLGTGGNIPVAVTIAAGRGITLYFDGSYWNPL